MDEGQATSSKAGDRSGLWFALLLGVTTLLSFGSRTAGENTAHQVGEVLGSVVAAAAVGAISGP